MKNLRVLIIDDDYDEGLEIGTGNYMQYYIDALQAAGAKVKTAQGWDDASVYFEGRQKSGRGKRDSKRPVFDLVILDISMPTGKKFNRQETSGGLLTGLAVSKLLSDEHQPHVVLSNMNAGPLPDEFIETSPYLEAKFLKPKTSPETLVSELKALLSK